MPFQAQAAHVSHLGTEFILMLAQSLFCFVFFLEIKKMGVTSLVYACLKAELWNCDCCQGNKKQMHIKKKHGMILVRYFLSYCINTANEY